MTTHQSRPFVERPTILVMGATCLDRMLYVPRYPRPDEKMRTTSTAEVCGGNAANVASTLSLLSTSSVASPANEGEPAVRVALLTKVGDDDCSSHLKAELESRGVDCSSPLFVSTPRSTASITTVIVSEAEHARTCLHSPGSCGELTADDVREALAGAAGGDELFRNVVLFHSDTRHGEAALAMAAEARTRGIPVSVDVEKDRGESMERLVEIASIVFGNEEKLGQYAVDRLRSKEDGDGSAPSPTFVASDSTKMDGDIWSLNEISSFLRHGNADVRRERSVVVTRGRHGAYYLRQRTNGLHPNEYTVLSVGTLRDAAIVDTTGAGDSFIAGYIMGLVAQNAPLHRGTSLLNRDEPHEETLLRLRLASFVAGKKLAGPGQEAVPNGRDVDECLGLNLEDASKRLKDIITQS